MVKGIDVYVEPERMFSGLWGLPEGDISQCYFGDTKPKTRESFSYGGQRWISSGGSVGVSISGSCHRECYPLLPLTPDNLKKWESQKAKYSYSGEIVTHKGEEYILGAKKVFGHRLLKKDEIRELARRMYAYGGMFTSGKNYGQLVEEWLDKRWKEASEEFREAFYLEKVSDLAGLGKIEIRELVEEGSSVFINREKEQLLLF